VKLPVASASKPDATRVSLADLPRQTVDALYVHIPFCFHKCHYCDFYSITRQTPERMGAFVDRLLREAACWAAPHAPPLRPRSVFFGGGTPSLLPADAMRRLIEGLARRVDLSAVDEWTVEVNPATADADYCAMLRGLGVDRLSFGAQSFDRADLAALERHHDPDDVPRALDLARSAGFSRLNLDLIFAVPGQTLVSWERSLEAALALQTPHLSCYALTYEPNTPLAVKKRMGAVRAVEEELELAMLRHARSRLASTGRAAYEVSNFAVPGEACRHNLHYWDAGSYAGLGPSAASHVYGWRWKNRAHLGEWERAVDSGQLPGAGEAEVLSVAQRRGEHAMLRLRLAEGLSLPAWSARWGRDAAREFAGPIERYLRAGFLSVDDRSVRLTEAGIAVADAIAAEFLGSVRE
jgi:oxygen-independent coproporphyrinogen-3 oxidase